MKRKKFLLPIVLCLMMAIGVTGCSAVRKQSKADHNEQKEKTEENGDLLSDDNPYFPVMVANEYEREFTTGSWQYTYHTRDGETLRGETELVFTQQTDSLFYGELTVSDERMNIEDLRVGQFLVRPDVIYQTSDTCREMTEKEGERLFYDGKLPSGARVVCQADEKTETGADQGQWIQVQGDTIRYDFYDSSRGTGKYQSYLWKKETGLIGYRMGNPGEGDVLRIWKDDFVREDDLEQNPWKRSTSGTHETPASEQGGVATGEKILQGDTALLKQTDNPYFPWNTVETKACHYQKEVIRTGNVTLRMTLCDASRQGRLYQMAYNEVRNLKDAELGKLKGKSLAEEKRGCDFGYFWVTKEEIYYMEYLSAGQREKLSEEGRVPSEADLVCTAGLRKDRKKAGKKGWHQGIVRYGKGIRQYYRYYVNQDENSSNIMDLYWKRGEGLIAYCEAVSPAGGGSLVLADRKYWKRLRAAFW